VIRAVLFDLDETLIEEDAVVAEAFAATAARAAERYDADPARLAADARVRARELWRAAPGYDWCARIGISSWEGLHGRFEGDVPELAALRAWAPEFRRAAWAAALEDQRIDDPALAQELADRYVAERAARHRVYPDAAPVLDALAATHRLGLVTNGASCVQWDKLRASGFADRFASVVVSAEVGAGKPDPAPFRRALRELGAEPADAVMVGDNLKRDIAGAENAGLRAVWLDRRHRPAPPGVTTIHTLADLPRAIA